MRPKRVLLIPMVLFLIGATAEAQQRSPNPPGQRGAGADSPPALLDLLNLLEAQQQGTLGARGGGGRGPVE